MIPALVAQGKNIRSVAENECCKPGYFSRSFINFAGPAHVVDRFIYPGQVQGAGHFLDGPCRH